MLMLPPDAGATRFDEFKVMHKVLASKHARYHPTEFVQLPKGETFYRQATPDPDRRRNFAELGVRIVATTDAQFPKVTLPDGEVPTKAMLTAKGMQHCVVDYHTKRVVKLSKPSWTPGQRRFSGPVSVPPELAAVPTWMLNHATVYWPGPEMPPVAFAPIDLYETERYSAEQEAAIETLIQQCRGWCRMTDKSPFGAVQLASLWSHRNTARRELSVLKSFEDLDTDRRCQVASKVTRDKIAMRTVPYLVLAE